MTTEDEIQNRVEYKVVPENNEGEDFYSVLRYVNGKFDGIIGSDGCDPEDNTLTRDYNWVAPALNDAYERGYNDGMDSGLVLGHLAGI